MSSLTMYIEKESGVQKTEDWDIYLSYLPGNKEFICKKKKKTFEIFFALFSKRKSSYVNYKAQFLMAIQHSQIHVKCFTVVMLVI